MSKKNFKIARKPGQGNDAQAAAGAASVRKPRAQKATPVATIATSASVSSTTRKTIEVPEDFFFRVKMRALERKILEKELWAEILNEYFHNHPAA
jgi:hypothetical protein